MPLKDPVKRKKYHAEYMREVWYPKNKKRHLSYVKRNKDKVKRFVDEYKRKRKCIQCGFSGKDFPCVLDFDHLHNGTTKKFNVANWSRAVLSIKSIKQEMEKCELVCANCHRIRTFSRKRA